MSVSPAAIGYHWVPPLEQSQSETQQITVNCPTILRYLLFSSVESAGIVTMPVFYTVVIVILQYFTDNFIICCKFIMKSSDQSKAALLVLLVLVRPLDIAAVAELRKVNWAANRCPAL